MKIFTIIILLFVSFPQGLFAQTKTEIAKFNIVKVETETKNGNWKTVSSTFYDRNGNQVMYTMSDSNFRYTSYYEYQDSLLVKITEVNDQKGKLTDSTITRFLYKLDSNGIIIEDKMILADGKVKVNKTHYSKELDIDTTYRYELINEGSCDSLLTECCSYVNKNGKSISYCHDSLGWKGQNLKITENFISDTLHAFLINECKIEHIDDCKSYYVKLYYDKGLITRFEDEKYGMLVEHVYEKNDLGLVNKHTIHSKSPNNEYTQVDTLLYYFRK